MRLVKVLMFATLAACVGAPALADVVVVVSAKSPITTLSQNQTVNIFLGKSNRFPDETPALPVDQREGAAVRDEFYSRFAGKSAAQVKAHWSKIIFTGRGRPPAEVENSGEVKKRVAANPGAIGYIDKSALDANVKMVTILP